MRCSRPDRFFLAIIPATCCSRPAKVVSVSVADGDTIIVPHKDQQQPDSSSPSSSSI